ncbi:hypothetical protein [Streptomyces sp. AC558_RSS880]|uniref:hypothetical protein n=1 Tax=Streptomyces sp. AC558_RSS880 TaxID=2823687 RepID=UPI001C246330|nr:hypothetical protein [Streptomyces sp. AC558_RSS880]
MTPTELITSVLIATVRDTLVHFGPSTASWRHPPRLHPHWDPSHAYAILASPGDRTS